MNQIKVALAEDQTLFRETLSEILKQNEGIEVVLVAENGLDLITQINDSETKPDVVLMDVEMPIMGGFQATKEVLAILPDCKIIYLSVYDNPHYIVRAIEGKAHGYITKDSSYEKLIEAIKRVYLAGFYFNEHLNYKRINHFIAGQGTESKALLTLRETEYVRYLCSEKSDSEIAQLMSIKKSTAQTYRKNIMKKINVKKTAGIVMYAMKQHLVQPTGL